MSPDENHLSASAQRVQNALEEKDVELRVVELPQSTRTALDAALAIGCEVGQIAKSRIFRGQKSGKAVLVITSGANRVDEARVGASLDDPLEKAGAEFVRRETGFAIGGVPPIGHRKAIATLIDEDLLEFEEIWAAAGTPRAVFRLTPQELTRLTSGKVLQITAR
jgi:prolyl-tRNA editing enzyme YbaK/EbsC (Cys-tRNA(Pro) deacylase)